MKLAIRNKTEGRIVVNGMKGLVLVPRNENKYIFIEAGPNGLEDSELLGLQRDNLIEVIDADKVVTAVSPAPPASVLPKGKKGKKDKKDKKGKKPEKPEDVNDAKNSVVTIMTPDGAVKSKMSYSVTGDAAQTIPKPSSDPEMLDLDKY